MKQCDYLVLALIEACTRVGVIFYVIVNVHAQNNQLIS